MRLLDHDVPRARIDEEIRAAAYRGHDPARWAMPLLDLAEGQPGPWTRVRLDEAEFAALWLPAHAGEPCHGDVMLLGDEPGGQPLAVAAGWLEVKADAYAAANPSCWGRITRASVTEPAPLVVSRVGVGDRGKPDHAALVVIDGLHRALGYWRAGLRTCEAYLR